MKDHFIRVTEVLSPWSGLHAINPHVLKKAADRGTRVHHACEAIASGLGIYEEDEETEGYIRCFEDWFETKPKVLAIEQRFWCEELGITGQVDLIIELEGGAAIVDIKTPARPSKTWALQGSAYSYLAKQAGYPITEIWFLQLMKDGRGAKMHKYDEDFATFKKCLDVYKYFNVKGGKPH